MASLGHMARGIVLLVEVGIVLSFQTILTSDSLGLATEGECCHKARPSVMAEGCYCSVWNPVIHWPPFWLVPSDLTLKITILTKAL